MNAPSNAPFLGSFRFRAAFSVTLSAALMLGSAADQAGAQVTGASGSSVFTPPPVGGGSNGGLTVDINPTGGGSGQPPGDSGGGGSSGDVPGVSIGPVPSSSVPPSVRGTSGRSSPKQTGGLRGASRNKLGGSDGGRQIFAEDEWNIWWSSNKFAYIELARVFDAPTDDQGARQETASEREMRLAGIRRLVQEDVIPVMRALTKSPDSQVRSAAIVALGKLRDRGGVDLARTMLTDASFDVRRSAMLSLGVMDQGRASYLLMNVADDSDVGRGLVDRESISIDDRGTALLTAALRGERFAEPVMIDMLTDREGRAPQMLAMTADAAGLMQSTDALRPLMDMAFDTSLPEYVRSSATTALGRIADPTVTPALMQLLEGNDLEPKRAAALALGEVTFPGSRSMLERLGALMHAESDAPTRHFLALTLGRIGGAHARATLTNALTRGADSDMRPWLALGLGICERYDPDGTVADTLLEAIEKEDNIDTKGAFAIALGLTRAQHVVAPLSDMLQKSGNDDLASHAALALGLTGQRAAIEPLRAALNGKTSPTVLRQAALALGILGDGQAIPDLVNLIGSTNNPFVASFASIGVAMMGDVNAVGPLLDIIRRKGSNTVTTTWAVAAIGQLFDQDRRPALSRLATGDNYHTRATAVRDLLSLGF